MPDLEIDFLENIIEGAVSIFFPCRMEAEGAPERAGSVGQYQAGTRGTDPPSVIEAVEIGEGDAVDIGDFTSRRSENQGVGFVLVDKPRDIAVRPPFVQGTRQFAGGDFAFADDPDIRAEHPHGRLRVRTDDPSPHHRDDARVDFAGRPDDFPEFLAIAAESAGTDDVNVMIPQQSLQDGKGVAFQIVQVGGEDLVAVLFEACRYIGQPDRKNVEVLYGPETLGHDQ